MRGKVCGEDTEDEMGRQEEIDKIATELVKVSYGNQDYSLESFTKEIESVKRFYRRIAKWHLEKVNENIKSHRIVRRNKG